MNRRLSSRKVRPSLKTAPMKTPSSYGLRLEFVPPRSAFGILAVLALTLAGCSYPEAIHTYEFLNDYDRMTDRFEPLLSLVYMPEGAEFSRYKGLIIGQVTLGERWVEEREKAQQYATYLRFMLRKRIFSTRKFDVGLGVGARSSPPELRLQAKITRFDMGSGWKRWASFALPFFQSGASDLQVEARITDAATGGLVLEFADRRRHLGNTPWGPNPKTLKDDYVMKLTLNQTAACLARFIEDAYHGLPPERALGDKTASRRHNKESPQK